MTFGYTALNSSYIGIPPNALWEQYINPYINYFDGAYSFIEPTPENFTNPEINDRWDHWHNMFIGTDTPNGYVLGTLPVPAEELVGGSWNKSGADASLINIDGESGQATLADDSLVTSNGQEFNVNFITPKGSVYPIKFKVFDPANRGETAGATGSSFYAAFRFYDSEANTNEDFANGGSPSEPLSIFNATSGFRRPKRMYVKNGSHFIDKHLAVLNNFPNSKEVIRYGDPSQPMPKFTLPSDYSLEHGIGEPNNSAYPNTGCIVNGIELDCNEAAIRGLVVTGDDFIFKNCVISNNDGGEFSNAVRMNNVNNCIIRWCEFRNINGDAVFVEDSRRHFLGFNFFEPVSQSGGDNGQFVNTDDPTKFIEDSAIYANIAFVNENNISKGSFATEGCQRVSQMYNYCETGTFAMTTGGFFNESCFNYCNGNGGAETNKNVMGFGASQSSGHLKLYQNIITGGETRGRLISLSGFNAASENWEGDEYARTDQWIICNLGYQGNNMIQATEPVTVLADNNIAIDTLYSFILDAGKGNAVLEGNITDITANGSYMDVLTDKKSHLYEGASVTIANANESANNGTFTMLGYFSNDYRSIRLDNSSAVTELSTPADYDANAARTLTTITGQNNDYSTPNLESRPIMPVPTLDGACENAGIVNLNYDEIDGHTLKPIFIIDGLIVQTDAGKSITLASDAAGVSLYKPNLSNLAAIDSDRADFYNDFNKKHLSACVEITNDTTGYKNLYIAKWSDGKAQKIINT